MTDAPQWHASFPSPNPNTKTKSITPSQLASKLRALNSNPDSRDLVVVDLRRTDFEVSEIATYLEGVSAVVEPRVVVMRACLERRYTRCD